MASDPTRKRVPPLVVEETVFGWVLVGLAWKKARAGCTGGMPTPPEGKRITEG
jgi:hypothetical protein